MNTYSDFLQNISGKRVLVMGLGLQGGGVSVAGYFAKHGSQVTVTDTKTEDQLHESMSVLKDFDISFHLGGHDRADFLAADLVIKGPSVRWDNEFIVAALDSGVPVTMETALFAKYCRSRMIGITGTRGKSTTTHMVYETLHKHYHKGKVYLAGNIPHKTALDFLDNIKPSDLIVLELSSWQLSGFTREKVSPQVAVFTNFFPDHLNYYPSMKEYVSDKLALASNQKKGDLVIMSQQAHDYLHSQYPTVFTLMTNEPRVVDDHDFSIDLSQKGSHNTRNAALAREVCEEVLGVEFREKIAHELSIFGGLPYRQQLVATFQNVTIINDSTSTTPIALQTALAANNKSSIFLIMGGTSKNLPYDDLLEKMKTMRGKIQAVYLMPGAFTESIAAPLLEIFGTKVKSGESDLAGITRQALADAQIFGKNCVLLFSPGAPSFAQFKNEFDRARKFDEAVFAIIKK